MALCRSLLVVCVVWALWLSSAHAQTVFTVRDVPNPRTGHGGWVSDPSGALGSASAELEQRLSALKQATGAEVAIAIVPSIGDAVPREFATSLFEHWKIGRRAEDDGALVLHVLDQRRIEIEVGYGLESSLPDIKCAWLIDETAIPHFRAGELGRGHLALLRGIDFAVRHPEATRAELLAGAAGEDVPAQGVASVPAQEREPLSALLGPFAPALVLAALFALVAAVLRVRAHRAMYREPKRRPRGPFVGSLLGALGAGFSLLAAYLAEVPALVWAGVGGLTLAGGLTTFGALRTWQKAKRRYAPRSCGSCGGALTLIDDAEDDPYLEPGQRVEERLRSVDYDVWKCACGTLHVEHYEDSGSATRCAKCGYRTEQRKSERIVRRATELTTGLAERHHQCAHCQVQRVENVELPRIVRTSPSAGSGGGSRGGGSFGGGRSGGGGAGRSY